jgi:hypothetical protein
MSNRLKKTSWAMVFVVALAPLTLLQPALAVEKAAPYMLKAWNKAIK